MIAFWILAPIMVVAALGILFVHKAVHAALLLAVVMISLAVLYAVQDAPFLFAIQIIVYTGAILMLFLFVLMLVGVDSSDSIVETIRGQRLFATVVGLPSGEQVRVNGYADRLELEGRLTLADDHDRNRRRHTLVALEGRRTVARLAGLETRGGQDRLPDRFAVGAHG